MPMTEEHKEALARGRREARIVKRYLEALKSRKRGRPSDPDRVKERIAKIAQRIDAEEDPLKRVELQQQKLDAEEDLRRAGKVGKLDELEAEFVEVVKDFSERKGISYTAWREEGVPAQVLKQGGLQRSRG